MLTRSGTPLPAEIYRLIYSHLTRHTLTRLLRVCRVLFQFTGPYIWWDVTLGALLSLLPGSRLRGRTFERIAIKPPHTLSEDYFDRFHTYATFVEYLRFYSTDEITSGPLPQSTQDWVASYTSDRIMLPHLRSIDLSFPSIYSGRQECIFWAQALISTSNVLCDLRFSAEREEDLDLFGPFLAKCPKLTRLAWRQSVLDSDSWNFVSGHEIPSTLECLDFEYYGLTRDALSWISQFTNLHTLRFLFLSRYSLPELEDLSNCTADDYSPGCFAKLKTLFLHLRSREWQEVMQVWNSPLVANLTHVTIHSHRQIGPSPSHIGELFTVLGSRSPGIRHLDISEGVNTDFKNQNLQLASGLLANLRVLPLRFLKIRRSMLPHNESGILETIGNIWPDLEILSLERTVIEVPELFKLSSLFPKLRALQVRIPSKKKSPDPLSVTFRGNVPSYAHQSYDDYIHRPALTIRLQPLGSRKGLFDFDEDDEDLLARTLVSLSSNLRIVGDYQPLMINDFGDAVDFYLNKRDQGRNSTAQWPPDYVVPSLSM